jgi:hypothetical protein
MAFNGSGTFNRIYNWVNDKANGFKIMASRMDNEFDGIATGLSQCITKDGQTTISANIPMANYKFTGLGNGTARTDVINVGQVQDGQFTYLGTTGGTADAYTLTPSPLITAYATTQQFTAKISATNTTTTPYLQISGITNPTTTAVIKKLSATKTEIAVETSDLLINGIYHFQRNSANDAWIIINPEKAYFDATNLTKATTTTQGVSYLNNPITIANNATNPNTQMDIGAGIVDYDNGSGQLLCQAMTKTLQSSGSWTAGTNQNGLDTGARANSTLYHIFQIVKNSDNTSDHLYSLSRTAPTVPIGYTLVAWVGSIRTNASGNIDQNYLAKKTINGQIIFFRTSDYSSGSTIIPIDNTTPQSSEGDQYMSIDFVPLSSKSILEIDVNATLSFSSSGTVTMALFQDSGANAICSKPAGFVSSAGAMIGAFMRHNLKSSSTSLTTFKFRAGNVNAGTTYFNGNGATLYNGTLFSSITIKEII